MVKVVKKNAPGGKSTKGSNAPGGTPSKNKGKLKSKVTRMNINRGIIGEDEKKRLITQLEMKREGYYVVRDKNGTPKLKKYKDGEYSSGFGFKKK